MKWVAVLWGVLIGLAGNTIVFTGWYVEAWIALISFHLGAAIMFALIVTMDH